MNHNPDHQPPPPTPPYVRIESAAPSLSDEGAIRRRAVRQLWRHPLFWLAIGGSLAMIGLSLAVGDLGFRFRVSFGWVVLALGLLNGGGWWSVVWLFNRALQPLIAAERAALAPPADDSYWVPPAR